MAWEGAITRLRSGDLSLLIIFKQCRKNLSWAGGAEPRRWRSRRSEESRGGMGGEEDMDDWVLHARDAPWPDEPEVPGLSAKLGGQVSLNDGAHQLRIFHNSPCPDQPFSVSSLTASGRSVVSVREIVQQLAGNNNLSTDNKLSNWIHQKLTRIPGSIPQTFNLTYVSRYITTYGVKFALDRAINLPWVGLTMAHFCFNPPAAFYYGSQWMRYDYPIFVKALDVNSFQQWPIWLDGFKSCLHRAYHEYSSVIIHLYESKVTSDQDALGQKDDLQTTHRRVTLKKEQLHYTLRSEAWTALHVFSRDYCNTGVYQLPLYQGAPSQVILHSLSQGKCSSIMNNLLHKNMIKLVEGASVLVRIADGRWDEEFRYTMQDTDQSYMPKNALDMYYKEPSGAKIAELMPRKTSQQAGQLILEQI